MVNALPSSSFRLFNDEFYRRLPTGIGIMLLQAPAANFCNQLSVHCCQYNVGTLEALKRIFNGHFSLKLASKGMRPHLTKESLRVGAKVLAAVHQHALTEQFPDTQTGRLMADFSFAGSLMAFEMAINPADTKRTMDQADKSLTEVKRTWKPLLSHLYRGSLANGLRQGGLWYGYRPAERFWSKSLKEHTPIDPHSLSGISLRTPPIAVQILTPVWLLEVTKNRLQNYPHLYQAREGSRYLSALRDIFTEQHWRMFTRGYLPKVGNVSVLTWGFLFLGRPKV